MLTGILTKTRSIQTNSRPSHALFFISATNSRGLKCHGSTINHLAEQPHAAREGEQKEKGYKQT